MGNYCGGGGGGSPEACEILQTQKEGRIQLVRTCLCIYDNVILIIVSEYTADSTLMHPMQGSNIP